jgi:predicted Zn-dependent protease
MRRIITGILCFAAFTLAGCQTNPSTGRSQFLLVSGDETTAMGVEAKPQLIAEYGGEHPSASLRQYITDIGTSMLQFVEPEFADLPWEFTLLDSDVINAFALPGGKVFMTIELLSRMSNEAQVAGVLGHEIGHVTARHVDERISQAMAVEVGLGVLGASTESQLILVGASLFGSGYQLHFGRDQELESDRQGIKYMTRAGYDPQGLYQVLEILRDAAGEDRGWELLSTHPAPERRLDQVTDMLKEEYAYTANNPSLSLHRDRFERLVVPHLPPPAPDQP